MMLSNKTLRLHCTNSLVWRRSLSSHQFKTKSANNKKRKSNAGIVDGPLDEFEERDGELDGFEEVNGALEGVHSTPKVVLSENRNSSPVWTVIPS